MAIKPPPGFTLDSESSTIKPPPGFTLDGDTEKPRDSVFKRYGKVLPIAGSMVGAGRGPIAAFGAASGEAARQLLGRAMGEDSPMTSADAAKEIAKEAALGFAGEKTGQIVGRGAKAAYKAFPKIAHGISGTPAVNIARAQQRGLKVFAPGIAGKVEAASKAFDQSKGLRKVTEAYKALKKTPSLSRKAAGEFQEKAEDALINRFFSPEERVLIRAKDAGYADKLMKSVMLKQERGLPITIKEAIGLRKLAPVKRAADTQRGISKNIELDRATKAARGTIAVQEPELARRLAQTEKSITASQLRKPFVVNKTNPDQMNKLFAFLSTTGATINPMALLSLFGLSPLSMGVAGATMGQIKKSVPSGIRRGVQRAGVQSLARMFGEE